MDPQYAPPGNDPEMQQLGAKLLGNLFGCCVACGCLLISTMGTEIVAWSRQASCDAEATNGARQALDWGTVIPQHTVTQMKLGLTNIFWHQVDVYDEKVSNKATIGYWTDVSLFFGFLEKYAYVRTKDGKEETVMEAWKPWGFYFGERYDVYRCANAAHEYMIEEDYWARPWFNWNAQTIFNIRKSGTQDIVATSKHVIKDAWSMNAAWAAEIKTWDDKVVAELRQDKFSQTGWFQSQKWHAENFKPDLLPNEVVSFLSAVYDIERAKDD